VNGLSDANEIANSFAASFDKHCLPHNPSKSYDMQRKVKERLKIYSAKIKSDYFLDVPLVEFIISTLARNKVSGLDGITAEHLCYAQSPVITGLTKMFNIMLLFEHVPDAFGCSVTFPIPKGPGERCSSFTDDYRGISVNPFLSKIYESCLIKKFEKYLTSSPHQFGFKAGFGCGHAIYNLHKTMEYYIRNGSNIHLCSLDLVKAFDKVDHYTLFDKLMSRKCPEKFINIIKDVFSKCFTSVKWEDCFSNQFNY